MKPQTEVGSDSAPTSQPKHPQVERRQHERPSIIKLQSIKWKILSIALFAAMGFSVFLFTVADSSNKNASLLTDIRDTRYPLQASLLSAVHELKMIQYQMLQVAASKDPEKLGAAEQVKRAFEAHLETAMRLDPKSSQRIEAILEGFQRYYFGARQISHNKALGLFDGQLMSTQQRESNARYHSLVNDLTHFQATQNHVFTHSVSEASANANESVRVVYVAGFFTALLVISWALLIAQRILRSIRSMVGTLREIARNKGDMSSRIRLSGRDEMTELAFWFNTFIDKLERVTRESTAEIKRIAFTDNLSGLANRRLIVETLDRALEGLDPKREQLAIIFIDLDNFKPVNDLFGHETGDALIKAVSKGLLSVIGQKELTQDDMDSVPIDVPMAARIGGDEFLIMLPRLKSKQEAEAVAQSILELLTEPFHCNGHQCNIGASLGISLYPDGAADQADDAAAIVDKADMAMYEAKKNGKNTYRFYGADLASASDRLLQLDSLIQRMLEQNEFHLAFQPKFDIKTGAYAGAEALIRWQSVEDCGVSPAELIAHAEQRGQIYAIDLWVLNGVCAQIRQWLDMGCEVGRVAINMSAQQARRPDLCEVVLHKIQAHGISAKHLEFEITETSALEHLDTVADNIRQLRAMAATVAIDDFGAGHSSLQLLINHPVDSIKVDKSLTEKLSTDKRSRAIVVALANMARSLNMSVVAEGIENRDQLRVLRSMGCDQGQGYFLARPMSAERLGKGLPKRQAQRKAS